jgi:hypothetical protein
MSIGYMGCPSIFLVVSDFLEDSMHTSFVIALCEDILGDDIVVVTIQRLILLT